MSIIIVFYEREECLIAIQFILYDYHSNNEIFTDPKVLGPVDSYVSENIIDEIVLSLSENEDIYLVQGLYNSKKITKMSVYTTHGQYIEFGNNREGDIAFSWQYHFNLNLFDGFVTFLASLTVPVI